MSRPNYKLTKTGKKRKGAATCTAGRYASRQLIWIPLKKRLQEHLKNSPKGEASSMARTLDIDPAMIHYYSCPVCEHDTEPNFTVGMLILMYLADYKYKASAISASGYCGKRPDVSEDVMASILNDQYNPFKRKPKRNYPPISTL